ncbi:MAG: hypothetical protein LBH91_07120 [Prevotellaceae bacterium]|jgi:hypothetical protein|nr:hypothetical protein [Prevotellaceae bacterium]
MKIFGWKRNKFKIFGIPVCIKHTSSEGYTTYLLGIPLFQAKQPLLAIHNDFSLNLPLNTKIFDNRISYIAEKTVAPKKIHSNSDGNFVILATELYDTGGHTELIINIFASMPEKDKNILFLTKMETSFSNAPDKIKEIAKNANICGIEYNYYDKCWKEKLEQTYETVITKNPKSILALIHMDDVFSATLLAMLKKNTDLCLLFYNHGSHFPSLGMQFCDLILEGANTMAQITKTDRRLDNTAVIGLPYLPESDVPKFTEKAVAEKRKEIGIPTDCLCTMSGAAPYKFFDNGKSPYFEMIYRLLKRNNNLYHVVISNFKRKQKKIIFGIFEDKKIRKRMIMLPTSSNYKILFKCADLFIDSFPVSSALTQVDLIALRIPNVVKINKDNPLWTFHEYMPENYPFSFDNISDMEQGIEHLLYDSGLRKKVTNENYKHFLRNFEGKKIACRLIEFIHSNNG